MSGGRLNLSLRFPLVLQPGRSSSGLLLGGGPYRRQTGLKRSRALGRSSLVDKASANGGCASDLIVTPHTNVSFPPIPAITVMTASHPLRSLASSKKPTVLFVNGIHK